MGYTQNNCIMECQTNKTSRDCKCTPYYLPRNISSPYCAQVDEACVKKTKVGMEDLINDNFLNGECSCISGCFEVEYEIFPSNTDLLETAIRANNKLKEIPLESIAVITFYFSGEETQVQIKSVLFEFSEILSNYGGILGLCLGLSFLSLVEIIYFLIDATLRVLKRKK